MARLFTPSESKYYLMALDAGTGSIRAVIFDLEGNQIAVGQAEWRHLAVLIHLKYEKNREDIGLFGIWRD